MRNRFNGSRRGRRPDSFGSVLGGGSPYDFTTRDEDSVEPVDSPDGRHSAFAASR